MLLKCKILHAQHALLHKESNPKMKEIDKNYECKCIYPS